MEKIMNTTVVRKKWSGHRSNAIKKGVAPLSLEQYIEKIIDAHIEPDQIGRTRQHYHLARYTDQGDYTSTSCRFIPSLENLKEQAINGGTARMAEKRRGWTKSNHPGTAAQAEKIRGRTSETHVGIAITSVKRSLKMTGRTNQNHAGRAAAAMKMAKPFAFIDPAGVTHAGHNVEEFCKAHGLLGNAMSKLKNGHLKSYHGWKNAPA